MPIPRAGSLVGFDLTNEEFYAATRFSELNLILFQSLLADAAHKKLNLKIIDASDKGIREFLQAEAELQGEIRTYEHLIVIARTTAVPNPQEAKETANITASKLSI